MTRPVHALVLGLTLSILSASAYAYSVENKGTPAQNVTSMATYGFDVATRTGLKTVVPTGWQLFVHKSVVLPKSMSWKLGEPWPAVLTNFAAENNVAILIDWDAKSVMFRSPEHAIEERATRDEIKQAAVTPLPSFEGALTRDEYLAMEQERARARQLQAQEQALADTRAQQKPNSGVVQGANVAPTRTAEALAVRDGHNAPPATTAASMDSEIPVIRTNVSSAPAPVEATTSAATDEWTYTAASATNKASVRSVAQAIANRHGLRLIFAAPEFNLKGPVTLLSESAQQDAWLLQKAIGHHGPAIIEVSESEKVLRVLSRDGSYVASPHGGDNRLNSSTPHVTDGLEFASNKEAAPVLVINLAAGEPLEDALVRFARSQGYTLEWKVSGGFEANRAMQFSGETVTEVLSAVLLNLGLSADVYTPDKHIEVRHGDEVTDR